MNIVSNSNIILSVLDNFTLDNPDDIMMQVAENFRKRRVEKILPDSALPSCQECRYLLLHALNRKVLLHLNR